MEQQKKRIGEASPEELLTMQGKYGKIKVVEVEDDGDTYCIYLKRPDFETLKAVTKVSKTDELEGTKVFIRNCMVGGAAEVLDDAVLLVAAASAASSLHLDPDALNEEDWASALTQSLWLENRYMDVMKSSIASALSGKDG